METVRIGICDDESFFRGELEKLVSVYANETEQKLEMKSYDAAKTLAEDVLSEKEIFHMLFLDVEMDEMSGMDAAKKLRESGYEGIICFVTGKDQYALDAFSVEAIGYLRKPAKYQDVKRMMQKALVQISYQWDEAEAKKRYLEITTQNEKMMIDIRQILYVEKRRNQCVIHLEDAEMVCYETLKSLYDRLDKRNFCFTHQGFIVNFDKIKEVKKDIVCLGAGREIPVSRRYQNELREKHMNKIYRLRQERKDD